MGKYDCARDFVVQSEKFVLGDICVKINKITAIICGVLTILSGVGTALVALFAPQTAGYDAILGIVSSVFSGFIVSLVVPTIGYWHERSIIIEKTDSNIRSLYINMYVISQIIGKILQQIPYTMRMESLSFKQVYELSDLNIDFSKEMNLNLFVPFFKQGKLGRIYDELREFQQTVYQIRSISTGLYGQTQEYDIQLLSMQNNQVRGIPADPNNNINLEVLKNAINVRTAKFHEYATGQLHELEKIAKVFYSSKGGKQSWEDIKPVLMQQAEEIMRR